MTEASTPIEQRAHSLWQRLKSTAEMGDAECEKLIALELTEDAPTPAADEVESVARMICGWFGGEPDAVAEGPHDMWSGQLWTVFAGEAREILQHIAAMQAKANG